MDWLVARLKEPSTWAGFAGICASISVAFPPLAPITGTIGAVCGALAAAMKDKS